MGCFKKPFQGTHPSVQIKTAASAESPFAVIPAIGPSRQDIFQSAEQVLRIIAGNQPEFPVPQLLPDAGTQGGNREPGFPK